MALNWKWHRVGGKIIDEGEGKQVAWLGYARKCGSSMRVSMEENETVLQVVEHAPELMQALARLVNIGYWRGRGYTDDPSMHAEWDAAMQQAKDVLAKVSRGRE